MKQHRILIALAALLCAASVHADGVPEPDVTGGVAFGVEGRFGGVIFDKDCWDDSVSLLIDCGVTIWDSSETIGIWTGLGAEGADVRWEDEWGEVKSEVFAIPFGASLLLRCPLLPGLSLRGEAGVRYVSMEVDDWSEDYYYAYHHRRHDDWDRYLYPEHYLDVDDTSLAVVGLQLEFSLAPAKLAIGGGYQFDLQKPDVEYLGESIGEVDLSGAFFYASLGVIF